MASRNVDTYRVGHEAFNQRDFAAMTSRYADGITLDRPRTGQDVPDDAGVQGRLPGELGAGLQRHPYH